MVVVLESLLLLSSSLCFVVGEDGCLGRGEECSFSNESAERRQQRLLNAQLGILLVCILLTGGQSVLFRIDRKHALSKLAIRITLVQMV